MDKRIDIVEQIHRRHLRLDQEDGKQDILKEYPFIPMANDRLAGTGEKEKIHEE